MRTNIKFSKLLFILIISFFSVISSKSVYERIVESSEFTKNREKKIRYHKKPYFPIVPVSDIAFITVLCKFVSLYLVKQGFITDIQDDRSLPAIPVGNLKGFFH